MFKLFGENYYFDIDKIEKEVELHITTGESQIHLVKYEMIKNMIETRIAIVNILLSININYIYSLLIYILRKSI